MKNQSKSIKQIKVIKHKESIKHKISELNKINNTNKKIITSKKELITELKKIGINGARIIEMNDPQFIALVNLFKRFKKEKKEKIDMNEKNLKIENNAYNKLLQLVIYNSLICYQLSGTGERYWQEFGEKIDLKKEEVSAVIDFLKQSKYNKRLHNIKINRLLKIKKRITETNNLNININDYKNMNRLKEKLESIYNKGKTINFAIKMYGYMARIITKQFIPFPIDIPIPLDSRITKYTLFFLNKETQKQKIIDFWQEISKKTKIPQLHIDSIIWTGYLLLPNKNKPPTMY